MEFHHIPVMLEECIAYLHIRPDGTYVDGTLGGAGHSSAIAAELGRGGRLIGIDQDAEAVRAAGERLAPFGTQVTIVQDNFKKIDSILDNLGIEKIDGALLDLGVSSHQLDEAERGFSYMADAPLDMRMDQNAAISAYDVVNGYSEQQLADIIFRYGEEKWAKRIAQFITERRNEKPLETTMELVAAIRAAIPKGARLEGGNPAKRTFQAIRIEVNGELAILRGALDAFADRLRARRQARGYYVPFVGGPDCEGGVFGVGTGVYLSEGVSGLRLRQEAAGEDTDEKTGDGVGGGIAA